VELEAELRAMPDTGFMGAAPRERKREELDEARRQLPNASEIARFKAQLQGHEAELQGKRARQPVPDAQRVGLYQGRLEAARKAALAHEDSARYERESFQKLRGQLHAYAVAMEWLKELIAFKRQALAAPTGVAPAFRVCETNLGPFRCTGTFDATWESVCTSGTQSRDSGHATVVISHDGYVKAQLQSSTPGGSPTTFIGPINAAGQVKGGRSSEDEAESWEGKFSLVTSALPSGASKPIGGGTYTRVLRLASGGSVTCSGTLKLR